MDLNTQNKDKNVAVNGISDSSKELNFTPKLVCVQYPGLVKNVDKAIETLGGITGIETATSTLKKTLELRFRPENYFCKPCLADRDTKPGLLVKVKLKKTENADGSKKTEVIDYDACGITAVTFKFNKLCDFQYLPLVSAEEKEVEDNLEYIYNKIVPDDIPDISWINNEQCENMPLFLPPTTFSRYNSSNNKLHFDRSKFYEGRFTPEYYRKFKAQELQQKIYRKDRGKMIVNQSAFFCSFEDETPQHPSKTSMDILSAKFTSPNAVANIKELFEKRPIWSKQALLYHSGVSLEQIKFILPTVAYYFVNGPWRVMWCKLGFDPRTHSHCRIYQTFDYRIRAKAGFKLKVRGKRFQTVNETITSQRLNKFSLKQEAELKSKMKIGENAFLLKPGMIPSARQMFYQLCDIHIPEIQAMISRLPPVLPDTKCNKKNGWLPTSFTDQCREVANRYIGAQVKKEILEDRDATLKDSSEPDQGELSEPDDLLEISESSSSSSESEDEVNALKEKEDNSDNEIDLDALEEVNKLIGTQGNNLIIDPGEGCSKFV